MPDYFPDAKLDESIPPDPISDLLRRMDLGVPDEETLAEWIALQLSVIRPTWIEGVCPEFRDSTLDNWETPTDAHVDILSRVRAHLRTFESAPDPKGLIFSGTVGSGKTHLAIGCIKELVRDQRRAVIINVVELGQDLKHEYQGGSGAEYEKFGGDIITVATDSPIVLLDDLGRERPTEDVNDRIKFILDSRHRHRRLTIITTNLTWPKGVSERYGPPIASRLGSLCESIIAVGVDWRNKKQGGG